MSNKHARFCFNNYIESTSSFSASSAQSSYPASNLVSGIRSRVWKPDGLFTIDSTNNKIYVDGTTYTITSGSYTSTTLASAIATLISKTVTRNGLGRFVISSGSSFTLNLSQQTASVWDTLGFLSTADVSGTSFTADERRYNNGEWLKVDLIMPQIATFAALIPPNETSFSCKTATIKLQGNNVDIWTNPPVDLDMEVSDSGAFCAPDIDTQACRYWRIYIDDKKNSAISVAVAYIGDSKITTNTNFATGFTRRFADQSVKLYSESGQLYVDRKPRYRTIESCTIMLLKGQDLLDMEQLYFDLRQGSPFFIVIDPKVQVTSSLAHLTHYVQVEGDPAFQHVLAQYYNLSFALRECI